MLQQLQFESETSGGVPRTAKKKHKGAAHGSELTFASILEGLIVFFDSIGGKPRGLLYLPFSRSRFGHCATSLAGSSLDVVLESHDSFLDLRSQICTMEAGFVYDTLAVLAVPPQDIERVLRPRLFYNNPYGVCKAHRIVGSVCWQ